MNGHFTCNRREKRLLTELSSTGGKKTTVRNSANNKLFDVQY